MAKQRFGINDAYRGTVGTVIGYEWRGKWCLRAKPLRVHNPRTAKQQSNRLLFKQMVELAGHMKMALRKGLRGVSLGMHVTECNLFVKRNKECFELVPLSPADSSPNVREQRMTVDWERLIISEGEVASPVFGVPDYPHPALRAPLPQGGDVRSGNSDSQSEIFMSSGSRFQPHLRQPSPLSREGLGLGKITFPFAPHAEGEQASGDDEVYLYAYCPEMEEGVLSAPAWRRMGSVSIKLPDRWQGKEVHLYGFAVDYEGNASATTYIGALEASPIETQRAASLQEGDVGKGEETVVQYDDKYTETASSTLFDKKIRFYINPY